MRTLMLLLCVFSLSIMAVAGLETYSYDGKGNNENYPDWGAANTSRIRYLPNIAGYTDGTDTPKTEANSNLPSARRVMEEIFRKATPKGDKTSNHLLLEFGHFIVQDAMSDSYSNSSEPLNIPCDGDLTDYVFCPATGIRYNISELENIEIPFGRMSYEKKSPDGPRATPQGQTHFLDLSQVYGHTEERVSQLRGENGRLRLDSNNLSPRENIYWNGMNTSPGAYSIYIVFMRFHNLLADQFAEENPLLGSDEIFLMARQKNIAIYQSIVEQKYVTSLLGQKLDEYQGYDPTVNPSVDEFFAAVSFRYAHTSFSGVIRLLDQYFAPLNTDPLYLRDIFKQPPPNDVPNVVLWYGGVEPFLRGLTVVPSKAVDASIVDDLNLWSDATSVVDVQRSRDVGIPSYNKVREAFGLDPMTSMEELASNDTILVQSLRELYGDDIDEVDAYVGALIEPHASILDTMGPLFTLSIKDQFTRFRDGDRFWYKNIYSAEEYEIFPTLTEIIQAVCPGMEDFPEDTFLMNPIYSSQTSASTGDTCESSTSQLSVLGGSLFIGWEVLDSAETQRGVVPGQNRQIDVTLRMNEQMAGPGFLGVGWGSQKMRGAEIWFCTIKEEFLDTYDGFAEACSESYRQDDTADMFSCCLAPGTQHAAPICADSSNPIFYELEVVDWCLQNDQSLVTVRAPVCDDNYNDIGEGRTCFRLYSTEDRKMDFILAYNPLAQNRPHGYQRRTAAQVDLIAGVLTQAETQIADDGLIATHAIFMLLSWMILAPAGVYIVRYMKDRSWRMVAHITIMGLVGSLMIPLLIGIEASVGATSEKSEHKIVGLSLVIVYFFMAFAGRIRYLKLRGKSVGRKTDFVTHVFHRYVGTAIILVSWWNCYTGLVRISPEDSFVQVIVLTSFSLGYDIPIFGHIRKYIFFPYISFVALVFLFAEWRKRRSQEVNSDRLQGIIDGKDTIWDDDEAGLDGMTMNTFLDVSKHTALCVVDGRVLDITDFMDIHPGGRDMLRYAQGSDITEEIIGNRDVDGIKHVHGSSALRVLRSLVKAKLVTDEEHEYSETLLPQGKGSTRALSSLTRTTMSSHSAFVPGRVVSLKYLTPSMEITAESRPVVWLRLAVPRRNNEHCRQPDEALVPTSAFTFRGTDRRGLQVERQYTPIMLDEQYCKQNRIQSFLHLPQFLEKIGSKRDVKEEIYDFVISLVPDGQMSKIFLNIKPNKTILCQGPLVSHRTIQMIDQGWKTVIMLAAGSGISPMLQVIDNYMKGFAGQNFPRRSSQWPRMFIIWFLKSHHHNYADMLGLESRARRSRGRLRYTIVYSSSVDTPSSSETGSDQQGDSTKGAEDVTALYEESSRSGISRVSKTSTYSDSSNTARKHHSKWAPGKLLNNNPAHRAKQTLKARLAKQSMNIQDLIETAHRNKTKADHDSTSKSFSTGVTINASFWRENGRAFTRRLNQEMIDEILGSIHEYVNEVERPFRSISESQGVPSEDEGPAKGRTASLAPIAEGANAKASEHSESTSFVEEGEDASEHSIVFETAVKPQARSPILGDTFVAVSGSPKFEMFVLEHLRDLGVSRSQWASFGSSRETYEGGPGGNRRSLAY